MLSKKVLDALNKQINAELYASYLYQSMSAHFAAENLKGMSHWMAVQAQEEHGHAMRIYNFILERGDRVALAALDAPPTSWKSPLAIFEAAYKHEQKVTKMIDNLVQLARAEKDHATEVMLQWFVTEQVEEEAQTSEIAQNLKRIGDSAGSLFMYDSVLGRREE